MSIKRLGPFAAPHKWLLIGGIVFTVTGVTCNMLPPTLSRRIVDSVFIPGAGAGITAEGSRLLILLVLGIGAATAGRALSIFARNLLLETFSQRTQRDVKQRLYDHIQHLSFEFFHHTRTGELMSRITSDIEAIRAVLVLGVMQGATGVFYVVISSIILFTLNWQLALVAIAATPFLALTTIRFRKKVFPRFQEIRKQYSQLNTAVQENVSGIRVVKSLMRHEFELEKFRTQNHGLTEVRNDAVKVWAKYMPLIEFLSGVSSAFMLFFGGYMVINGTISLGTWVQFNGYLWMIVFPMRMLGDVVNQLSMAAASAERVFEILDAEPNIKNGPRPRTLPRVQGDVEFRNVSWGVDGQPILRDINLHAPPGSTVAIMGATGSGKSSLVHLISRFYDPDRGSVLIDGVDVRDLDLAQVRRNVALVAQESFLFSETMYNNLTYGREGVPIEFVRRVAVQTQANEFIRAMTEGYDTVVGERGVGLSGGQKQRAALARALLKRAPILILDDATSAVDMETEAAIQEALKNMKHDVTTFIIAHRISSVKHADQIVVLRAGEIAECGTHDELLRRDGEYAAMYAAQYENRFVDGQGA